MNNFGESQNAEIAIIPKGTVIHGNIDIDGKLEMYGEINGNINSNDRVNICGIVAGDIRANDLYTKDSFIEGKIECVQGAVVHDNTVILGDICADSLVIDGAIQGKLDVKGCVTVGNKAILDSDIRAKAIQVSNGAAINGHCSLCYAEVNMNDVFPATEPEPEAEETKAEEVKTEETKAEETKAEEVKAEETKAEEVKAEETKAEEVKTEESKTEEAEEADKPKALAKPRAVAKKKS